MNEEVEFNAEDSIAFDIETTGLDPLKDSIFAFVETNIQGESIVWRLDGKDGKNPLLSLQRLKQIFEFPRFYVVCHNAKFEMQFVKNTVFVHSCTQWQDTMILSQIAQNLSSSHALDYLTSWIFKYDNVADKILNEWSKKRIAEEAKLLGCKPSQVGRVFYEEAPVEIMEPYQIADGERTILLWRLWFPKVCKNEALLQCYNNELEMLNVGIKMQHFGLLLDKNATKKMKTELRFRLAKLQKKKTEYGIGELNFGSSKQVSKLFYETLKMPVTRRTESGADSSGKDAMMEFREKEGEVGEIADLVLQYRAFTTGLGNMESYIDFADENNIVHPTIHTNKATTGRQSVSEPNLQNVAKETSVRTIYSIPARRCFISRSNATMFLVDYAGIEMRLIVEACGEPELVEALQKDIDMHGVSCKYLYGDNWEEINWLVEQSEKGGCIFKLPDWAKRVQEETRSENNPKGWKLKEIKKQMRNGAKNYGFGRAYGGQFEAVTKGLVGLDHGQRIGAHTNFGKKLPRISYFADNTIAEVRANGFVTTSFGRKLFVRKSEAFAGANYKIQGTAGEILKRGQTRLIGYYETEFNAVPQIEIRNGWSAEECKKNFLVQATHADQVVLNLSIHDENIIHFPDLFAERETEFLECSSYLMTTFEELKVPLEVEWKKTRTSWANAKELETQPKKRNPLQ